MSIVKALGKKLIEADVPEQVMICTTSKMIQILAPDRTGNIREWRFEDIDGALEMYAMPQRPEDMRRIWDLEDAIKLLRRGDCWCGVGIGDPNLAGGHTPACKNARRLLAAATDVVRNK